MSDMRQLAADIAEHGTKAVFGITGSGQSLTLLDELQKLGVDVVRTYFEGSAALMAGTVGRISGRAGVAYCIKGPGLANALPGLAVAHFESFPLVALAEAYAPGEGAGKVHKRLDQPLLTAALVKGARYLGRDNQKFREVAGWSESEIPGPILLQLAGAAIADQAPIPVPVRAAAHDAEILQLIEKAKRPVVICGTLAIRSGWAAYLARIGVPIFTTAAAKGVIDEAAPFAAGVFTGVGLKLTPEQSILPQADLVVGIGLRPAECLTTRPFACPAVNIDPADAPGCAAFGFAARSPEPPAGFWEQLQAKRWGSELVAESLADLRRVMAEGFLPGACFDTIASALGRSVRLVLDTGYFCTVGEHCWLAPAANLCLLSGQGRYMGTAIPMAIGAAIQEPNVPVVAVAGDGGIAMYLAEIRIAVERRLPVLFVLMSDGRYGSVATRAIKEQLTLAPMTFAQPSWRAVMESFGMPASRVADAANLHAALSGWRSEAGPAYVEIAFDPERYQHISDGIR